MIDRLLTWIYHHTSDTTRATLGWFWTPRDRKDFPK